MPSPFLLGGARGVSKKFGQKRRASAPFGTFAHGMNVAM
jgi:23S rRNA pseudoU1915 N3-methylase RlmH